MEGLFSLTLILNKVRVGEKIQGCWAEIKISSPVLNVFNNSQKINKLG